MDSTALNLATMFIGALLGAVLVPFGQEVASRFFAKRKKEHGFTVALLFLLVANGAWIIGEVLSTTIFAAESKVLDLRNNPKALGASYLIVIFIFLVAAYCVILAYQHLHEGDVIDRSLLETRNGPIGLFIKGNLFWIGGEAIMALFEVLTILTDMPLDLPGYAFRLLTSVLCVVFFALAASKLWKSNSTTTEAMPDNSSNPI